MKFSRVLLLVSALVCAYLIIVLLSGAGWNPTGIEWNFSNTGAFGDSFGPLSTIMAGVAAIAAIMAYRSQSEELDRLKSEAIKDREERAKQDFERTFFNLLPLFRETVKEIEIEDRYNQNPVRGRDAIKRLLEEHIGSSRGSNDIDASAYMSQYMKFRDDLAHYFRLFYHILKLIDDSGLENRKTYSRILRATLSNAEITIIALNCMHGGGRPKLKILVEKYAMLHNISSKDFKSWRMGASFHNSAIGDRAKLSNGELGD